MIAFPAKVLRTLRRLQVGGFGPGFFDHATQLLGIFQASDEMLKIGVPALRTLSWSFLFGGITIVVSSVFQALGRGIQSMLISIFRQLLIVLPLAYALSKTGNLNLVWWSFPVSDVLALIFAGYLLLRTYRQVIQPLTNEDFLF